MGWEVMADNDQETVKVRKNPDGTEEYLHIYKDPALREETSAARAKNQPHDHIVFGSDGSTVFDSTVDEPSR